MKDALNVKPVLLKQNATQMDAFMKDALNVKPVLLKQNVTQLDKGSQCEASSFKAK